MYSNNRNILHINLENTISNLTTSNNLEKNKSLRTMLEFFGRSVKKSGQLNVRLEVHLTKKKTASQHYQKCKFFREIIGCLRLTRLGLVYI